MMRGCWCILLLMTLSFQGLAQKAYELVGYTGKLQGKTVKLELGTGYIGASKISFFISPKQKPQLFLPENGAADAPFILRNTRKTAKDYFVLDKMQDAFEEIPTVVTGRYWFDKKVLPVKFYLIK